LSDDRLIDIGRLSLSEKDEFKLLFQTICDFESVSKKLQRDGISLAEAYGWAQFEALLRDDDDDDDVDDFLEFEQDLGVQGRHNFNFEKAVIKIQNGLAEEALSSSAEKLNVRCFLRAGSDNL